MLTLKATHKKIFVDHFCLSYYLITMQLNYKSLKKYNKFKKHMLGKFFFEKAYQNSLWVAEEKIRKYLEVNLMKQCVLKLVEFSKTV